MSTIEFFAKVNTNPAKRPTKEKVIKINILLVFDFSIEITAF